MNSSMVLVLEVDQNGYINRIECAYEFVIPAMADVLANGATYTGSYNWEAILLVGNDTSYEEGTLRLTLNLQDPDTYEFGDYIYNFTYTYTDNVFTATYVGAGSTPYSSFDSVTITLNEENTFMITVSSPNWQEPMTQSMTAVSND